MISYKLVFNLLRIGAHPNGWNWEPNTHVMSKNEEIIVILAIIALPLLTILLSWFFRKK